MKTVMTRPSDVFRPCTLTITIESEEELRALSSLSKSNLTVPEAISRNFSRTSASAVRAVLDSMFEALRPYTEVVRGPF